MNTPSFTTTQNGNDNQYLNYLTLTAMVTQSMQEACGRYRVDFDLASEIAWKLSRQIPSDLLIERAKTLTVDEILKHNSVRKAELSKQHEIPFAEKKPPRDHELMAITAGLIAVGILMLVAYWLQ